MCRPVDVQETSRAPGGSRFRLQQWLVAAALLAAVLLVYQPVWQGGFIWDDDAHVTCPELRSWQSPGRLAWPEHSARQDREDFAGDDSRNARQPPADPTDQPGSLRCVSGVQCQQRREIAIVGTFENTDKYIESVSFVENNCIYSDAIMSQHIEK
jgi:hypothetical protein